MLQTIEITLLRRYHICRARIHQKETANVHTFGPDKVYSVNIYAKFRG